MGELALQINEATRLTERFSKLLQDKLPGFEVGVEIGSVRFHGSVMWLNAPGKRGTEEVYLVVFASMVVLFKNAFNKKVSGTQRHRKGGKFAGLEFEFVPDGILFAPSLTFMKDPPDVSKAISSKSGGSTPWALFKKPPLGVCHFFV